MSHNSSEAKQQMLEECRKIYRHNPHELSNIEKFEQTYRSCDAIRWYTKPCFLFRLINTALRSNNQLALYKFRYFIVDLSMILAILRPSTLEPNYLYRGAKMHRDEIEELCVGSLVAANQFLSTSRNRHIAELFVDMCPITGKTSSYGRDDIQQFALFEIHVDWNASSTVVVADARTQSHITDEEEMIFDLGTIFVITNIFYDMKHCLWEIQMKPSSEMVQLNQEYNAYIRDILIHRNANIVFGCILADNLAKYSQARNFFHYLLRSSETGSEDRPKYYCELARVYNNLGKFKQAINYSRAARLLQLQCCDSPRWQFDYGDILSRLSRIYLKIGDSAQAICMLEEASTFLGNCPYEYNYEWIFHANRLSYTYYLHRQNERALQLITVILDEYKRMMPFDHPSHAEAWHTMGLIQRALNNPNHALAAFKEALRMREVFPAPDYSCIADSYCQISLLHEELGDLRQSVKYAQKAAALNQPKRN